MMSTAILMAMGAEQSGKQLVALDVENFDRPTFAQTLDARVGTSPAILEKDLGRNSKVATLPEAANGKTEATTKNLVDAPDLAAGVKAKIFAGQLTPAQVESKEINLAKIALLQPAIVAGTKIQKKTEEAETWVAEPVGNIEENQTDTPVVAQVAPIASLQTETGIPLEQQAEGNQIQLPRFQTPVSQREALATGKALEAAPEKKTTTKTQAGYASQPVVTAKSGTVTMAAVADETKSTHGVGVQVVVQMANPIPAHTAATPALPVEVAASATPAKCVAMAASGMPAVPIAASNVALNVVSGQSGVGSGAASLSGGTSSGVGFVAAEVSGSNRNAVHGAKTSISDRETTQAAQGDLAAPAKPDAKEERSQVAANAGSDSDTKTRTTSDTPVAVVHAVASGGEVTAGSAAPAIAGLTKLSGGETGISTAGSSNGLREQDGSDGVVRSMEPMEPMPRTLSATPTALEVGIPDGTHGWLKVRAEISDGGVVNASVSAASLASQEMLHRELPSLTAYLQSEKVAVNTVVVHPAASAGAESRSNSAGPESGGSGQAPRQSHEGGQQQSSVKTAAEVAEGVTSYRGLHGVDEDGMSPLASYGSGGSWLSVRA
ncbi:hypothetical protein RBB75_17385 [Tunturibacter empetritectus]|uniref:Flagellar hook-length control protein FliK n=1 Tax=Tunturiibacter empetritectus TaxID=3069691 RepID=A0AAU7ZCB5_9BACT